MINIEYCECVLVSKVCVEYLPTKINGGSQVNLCIFFFFIVVIGTYTSVPVDPREIEEFNTKTMQQEGHPMRP